MPCLAGIVRRAAAVPSAVQSSTCVCALGRRPQVHITWAGEEAPIITTTIHRNHEASMLQSFGGGLTGAASQAVAFARVGQVSMPVLDRVERTAQAVRAVSNRQVVADGSPSPSPSPRSCALAGFRSFWRWAAGRPCTDPARTRQDNPSPQPLRVP